MGALFYAMTMTEDSGFYGTRTSLITGIYIYIYVYETNTISGRKANPINSKWNELVCWRMTQPFLFRWQWCCFLIVTREMRDEPSLDPSKKKKKAT